MKKLIFIVMTLVLAGCAAMGSAMGSQSEVEQNKEKWQDAGISHYRYNLFISCFCVFVENMPLVIEVQDGEVVSMEYQNGNEIDPSLLELFEKYATIDRIFAEVEAGLNGAADNVVVTYDPTYGFPTEVTIDVEEQAADDELYLTISDFEELP
ncbi:MAG TPA: DUF6174 domain-containing protein [Anaerolineales bacterium]|nr:DUF6174 domain-containing protein [Anaerolineales bacterium]